MNTINFFKNKKVLMTGHTGFKGSWLSKILIEAGSRLVGIALEPPKEPNLFNILDNKKSMKSYIGDIRDLNFIKRVFEENNPEIVFHLAAQPIVRESYIDPHCTYETNIMGTVNLFESIRNCKSVRSVVNVTTDKVYQNKEWEWGYRENDTLNGYDPYSNSKSCSELITDSYKKSFFLDSNIAISTARAGNVIGGGDFAKDRIVPDCIKAAVNKKAINIRNPNSIRPYQHVLEPLYGYLLIAKKQFEDKNLEGTYNIGPEYYDCIKTEKLVDIFCFEWGENLTWEHSENQGPHEANFLRLDCSKIKKRIGWKSIWNINEAIKKTIEWTKKYYNNEDMIDNTKKQINDYLKEVS